MSNRNNTSEEDYLDSLLRSITGAADEQSDSDSLDDSLLEEEINFGNEDNIGASDEEFLSDFEKEFFGDSDEELLGGIMDEVDSVQEEAPLVMPSNVDVQPEMMTVPDVQLEPEVQIEPELQMQPNIQPEANEEVNLDDDMESLRAAFATETMSDAEQASIADDMPDLEQLLADMDDTEEQALVNEAIASEDTAVEEDLKGLYDILGMEEGEGELPDDIEEKPKKKGLFSRKEKKEKPPKEKKKKNKKEKKSREDLQTEIDDDFSDFGDIDLGSLGGGMSDDDEAFGLDDSNASEEIGGDLGLDDSIFDDMGENDRLMKQMDDGEIDEDELLGDEEDPKEKKKREKKEKKEKAKKEKAEKAKNAKSAKAKKPKKEKEKKVKEPDEIIKVPTIFIIFAISFVVVVVIGAKLGGDYYHYNEQFYEAIALYVYGSEPEEGEVIDQEKYESKFNDAYTLLRGLEMKETDHQTFFDQLETIMLMDRHYEAFKTYMLLEDFEHGLDSLIKAVKMYDKYQNEARELECFDEMTVVLGWVDAKLKAVYGVTESQAREMYMIKDDDEYAVVVRSIAAEARLNYQKNNVEEE